MSGSNFDPSNPPPSNSVFGANPRFVLIPAVILIVGGGFLLWGWLLHG